MTTASWSSLVGLPSQVVNGPNFGSAAVTAGSIKLATSGGTATALNYYEEYTDATFAFTVGAGYTVTPITTGVSIVRIGKTVTMKIPAYTVTGNGGAGTIHTSSTALPARFMPTGNDTMFPVKINNAGVAQGVVVVNRSSTTGVIAIGTGFGAGAFGAINLSTYGLSNDTHVTWTIQ